MRGQNVLYSLKKKQHSYSWGTENQQGTERWRDSDIAQWIGNQPVTDKKPGLGMKVRIDANARSQEPEETFVFMNNQYDILFLIERARRHGYAVFLEIDPQSGQQQLYFGTFGEPARRDLPTGMGQVADPDSPDADDD